MVQGYWLDKAGFQKVAKKKRQKMDKSQQFSEGDLSNTQLFYDMEENLIGTE